LSNEAACWSAGELTLRCYALVLSHYWYRQWFLACKYNFLDFNFEL
jgi:hypothetical protein